MYKQTPILILHYYYIGMYKIKLVHEMLKVPQQLVSSKRNHQVAVQFRKMGCLNVCKLQSFSCKHKLHLLDPPV